MAGGKGKIRPEDGVQFSSTNQPPNAGRKPRVFTQISKEFQARGIERATPEAVAEAYEYLLALTMQEVSDIAFGLNKTDDLPAIMALAAQEMKGKRALEIIREMLDRAHGKAIQKTEQKISLDAQPASTTQVTQEQVESIINMLGNAATDSAKHTETSSE